MEGAGIDVEATLLELAAVIPGDFAAFDDARQLFTETFNDPEYGPRALEVVKKCRATLDVRADNIIECGRLAPQPVRAKLFDAAARLRNLDRDVPHLLTNAAAALPAAEVVDVIGLGDVVKLIGQTEKTVRNKIRGSWPKSYSAIRPELLESWPAKAFLFPESYTDVRAIIDRQQ
jgi:hypothetical protein